MPNKKLTVFTLVFLVQSLSSFSQDVETIVKGDFAIRDFLVFEDSLFFIKKRDVFLMEKNTRNSYDFFVGGFGLKIYNTDDPNILVTVSNELVNMKSSVRFYNKSLKDFERIYYYTEGKFLDVVNIIEAKLLALSSTNKKIIFLDYQDPQKIVKIIELDLNALSRNLIYQKNMLYFATDMGEIYSYNFSTYTKRLIHEGKGAITDFTIGKETLVYATTQGDIVKVDLQTRKEKSLHISNNFVSVLAKCNDTILLCGSWEGPIYVIDLNEFSIQQELNYHDRAVLQIKKYAGNMIYSSGLDKTIKKWTLK